ncbi:MAG: beta-lactamase family protein [Candidatus Protistobacter heckmanni]|nr:beta-lactamase family protein [Candidatus Protistobacter heckmanni]
MSLKPQDAPASPALIPAASPYDFSPVHAAMQSYVDKEILAGVSSAVLVGGELVDLHCAGWADRENQVALREDHLFRVFSNTKLVTSIAVLQLMEQGLLALDDPVQKWLPQLANRRVLRPGAASLDDTEPASGPITVRHLLTHSSGLSYGLLDPGTLMYKAYTERKVLTPYATLAQLIDTLEDLPLSYHPGTSWEYSIATDVLSRLVEVVSGLPFDRYLQKHVFDPLGMADTFFSVPPEKQHRLAAYYAGADMLDPMKPGLTRLTDSPYPDAFLKPVPRPSGGGGLVSSMADMMALIRSLLPDAKAAWPTVLKPETVALMMRNHLPAGVNIAFSMMGPLPGKVFGLGGAVTVATERYEPAGALSEFQWGGIAGTHWWIAPRANAAGLLMTQRRMAFWHPYSFDFKRQVHAALEKGGA